MKLVSNAEAPPILGKVKQKIIDIGAVTHVIIDNPTTGYGLFITTMLEEGEK